MKEYVTIGKTKVRFDNFEKYNSNTRYTLMTRQKVKNMLVDCDYFEGKDSKNIDYYSFHVTIKVFGKHPHKPLHWFEMYANTLYTKYNYINRCTKTTDRKIEKGTKDNDMLNRILNFINENFEHFTRQFISYTSDTINKRVVTKETPKFIVDLIDEFNKVHNAKECLNN